MAVVPELMEGEIKVEVRQVPISLAVCLLINPEHLGLLEPDNLAESKPTWVVEVRTWEQQNQVLEVTD